jgi:hypothetical protein
MLVWFRSVAAVAVMAAGTILSPTSARAWGYEGHEIIADIARGYLTPTVRAKVDAMLATDTGNTLTAHDMAEESHDEKGERPKPLAFSIQIQPLILLVPRPSLLFPVDGF